MTRDYVGEALRALGQNDADSNADPRNHIPNAESPDDFSYAVNETEPSKTNGHEAKVAPSTKNALVAFPLVSFENIALNTDRRGYLVKGLLPSRGLAVIWGPPKCGKSFWATDLGLHIALGWEYRGRRVQQAAVVYIALEGRHGLPARLEAFRQHHRINAAPFYLLTTPLDLAARADALIASIEAQLSDTKPGAIVIDTLNRSLVGSESKDEDMARYLAAAGKIEEKFGCLVAIVHHCGIDATRPRGHTSLSGAVEVQLAVKRGAEREVIATVELAKDFPEGAEIFSRLEQVDVGTDPDGDKITSIVVVAADAEAGSIPATSNHIPPNTRTISIEQWRSYAYQGTITESDKPDARQKAFVRAVNKLLEANLIGK
jgi:hypothetical protein